MIGLDADALQTLTGRVSSSTRLTQRQLLGVALIAADLIFGVIAAAYWFLHTGTGEQFLAAYPGHSRLPDGTPGDAPWWVQLQHALNFIIIILLIRSGWLIHRQTKPDAYWTRNNTGRLKTKRPPTKMSIYLWLHLSMDSLWFLNGVVFVVALLTTGNWARIVPTHWDIFPNAVSAGLQYLSFDWPNDAPWVNYNALQVLAYGVTVFVAGPLAALTGIRISPVWRSEWRLSKVYPIEVARKIHLPVMIYFSVFIVAHVALVFTTGLRVNLNFMYADVSPGSTALWGLLIFLVTLLAAIAGWLGVRPLVLQMIAGRTGKVTSR